MKIKGIKGLTYVAMAGLITAGCTLLKDLDYKVTPSPLEMHGDKVNVKVDITVPEKGIKKKAYVEITPMLGSHALKPVTIAGEKATVNGVVIPFKPGGKLVYEDEVDYSPDMEVSELTISGTVYKKGKEKATIEPLKIADATIVTPLLVNKDFRMIFGSDEFKRVTQQQQKAEINYLKGSYVVRPTEKTRKEIKDLETFLTNAQTNPKINLKRIVIESYASLEGEENRNNELSTNRSGAAKKTIIEISSKKTVANKFAQEDGNYTTVGKGEDYEGFKKAVTESKMDSGDKDRILRVLEMFSASSQREQAIRDLSTYLYLDKNIFPAQRRSEIVVNYELVGYSDEELIEISKSNIEKLNLEEILFTATLTDDLNEKMRLYKEAERMFPNDYRPANNVGVVYYLQNNLGQAETQLNKANGIKENPISKNNLAAISGVKGNRSNAKDLLTEASGAGKEVGYNTGILNIQDGDYDSAISNFGEEATFNKALAQLLSKDANSAKSTINGSDDNETARGFYLKAIIAAHGDNIQEVVSNLKSAFAKDGSLKEKASKDREFIKYMDNTAFTSIVK